MDEIIIAADDDQYIQEEEVPYCQTQQLSARESMKASVLAKKQRAARFRKALCKKSSIMKIKLWQNLMTKKDVAEEPEEEPMQPLSPIPQPGQQRLSPDITSSTNYRYATTKRSTTTHSSNMSMSTSSSSNESDGDESDREIDKAHESDASSSAKSMQESSLLLSPQGDPIVQLDPSVVEDFIRSGKPIRAAALAALEAVHGKKFTDSEALQQLRKVYTLKPSVPKGRGRRTIAKRASQKPIRGPQLTNWCKNCESLIHRNCYYQVGDIVKLVKNKRTYFLQIQTLFKDWREGAYASMTWLTPKTGFKHKIYPFNPRHFDIRRDIPSVDAALDDVTHVMHMPTDYFDGHPSYWRPRPGMVYMRLGEPLVEFRPLEQPKVLGDKAQTPAEESSQSIEPASDSSAVQPIVIVNGFDQPTTNEHVVVVSSSPSNAPEIEQTPSIEIPMEQGDS